MQLAGFGRELSRVLLFATLSLFAIPGASLWFVAHAQAQRDQAYLTQASAAVERESAMTREQQLEAKEFLQRRPPSRACRDDSQEAARYRANVCAPYSELWQYDLVRAISAWTLAGGAAVLFAIFAIGALAFVNRDLQYTSFVAGWGLLRVASAASVIVQGALLVWLSFWVTAFFFERYFVKLILIAGVLAGVAVLYAIVGIFRRPPRIAGIEGELIRESDAPALWRHIRQCAQDVGTAPPDHIVAGIDVNFFVTESPLTVGEQTLQGRCLFVSLPLLRILDRTEADAVLGHELAHFSGGDTASSAALGPKLVQYDHYCQLMQQRGATRAVFHLIYLYRFIFELALRRDSRAREFRADRVAAKLASAQGIVRSLIKISAYSCYRSEIEQQLFQQDARHEGALGIAGQVAVGLAPYAASAHFTNAMKTANVPHPFDSHPPLEERMQNVGLAIEEQHYSAVVTSVPVTSWVTDIAGADAIEQRLWAAYEQGFADAHEHSLAWRYEPANDAERAIVLKYFPPLSFALKKEQRLEISYAGLSLPGEPELLSWDRVDDLNYTDGMGGDVLEIIHPEKGLIGRKTTKVKLPGISKQRDHVKQALGHYWQRHKAMRQQQLG
jgi:Zn-dependent protease with chaperone function